MPQPWPQYDPDDPNSENYNLDNLDQQAGVQDQDPVQKPPQWAAQGPAAMPHSAQDAAAQGAAPPAMPNPSIWRKVLAGAIGGMAGVANTRAGRSGGPSQPINAAPATANILGTNDYNRKLANWAAGEKQKDAAATLERNRNEDSLKYQEVMARVGEANSTTALNNDTRKQNAATRSQAEIDAFQKGKFGADTATRPDIMFGPPPSDNPPLQSNQSNLNANADDKDNTNPNAEQAVQATDLPVTDQETELNGMPQPPQLNAPPIPGMPNLQQPIRMAGGTKPGFSPAQAPKGYNGPPLYNADPAMQAQMMAQAKQQEDNVGKIQMTPELASQLESRGLFNPLPVGSYVAKDTLDKWIEAGSKTAEGAKAGSAEWDLSKYAESLGILDPKTKKGDPNKLSYKQLNDYNLTQAQSKVSPDVQAQREQTAMLGNQLKQMQLDQMPTKDDIDTWADEMLQHKMSPEVMAQLIGRGGGGNIKAAIASAAMRKDPTFDFNRSQSDYQFTKTPGFQNSIRYMDSAQQSIPSLVQSATQYGNQGLRFTNGLINLGQKELQNPQLADFRARALLVSDEVAKILSGAGSGGATSDAKLKQAAELINTSDDPKVIAASLAAINDLVGMRRKSITLGTGYENFGSAGTEVGIPSGMGKTLDQSTAQGILQKAGGDPQRARELAVLHGWIIPQSK